MSEFLSRDSALEWPDNPSVKAEVEAYRKRVKDVLDFEISNNGNVHPWMEHGFLVKPKLRMFDLREDESYPIADAQSNTAQNMWEFLDKVLSDASPKPNRHLIFLQDVDPRFGEVLGVKLGIPPEFWLAHCSAAADMRVVDCSMVDLGSSTYLKVVVPVERSLPEDPKRLGGHYMTYFGTFTRSQNYISTARQLIEILTYFSYWSKAYGDKSWIGKLFLDLPMSNTNSCSNMVAVCLMDAPTLHLKPTFSPPPDFKPLVIPEDWMPGDRSPGSGLRQVMLGLTNHQIHPPNSIFDATIKAHETGKILATEDPFSATTLARNVILAAWEDKVSVDVQLANQVQATDWIGHVSDWNTNAHQERDVLVNQVNKTALEYGKLMADRFSLQLHRAYLASIIQKFRQDDTAYLSSQKNEVLRCAIIDERRHWRALQVKLERVEAIIADHMAMYAQRAAMEEAFASEKQALESYKQTRHANEQAAAANRMARSSGQLAKIATVVVPCTIVASILSMNGDFAAGERLFFVYWVISLPVTFVLLGWVLQKDISAWIRRDGERAIATPDEEKSGSISG